jgi:hypothetical protein
LVVEDIAALDPIGLELHRHDVAACAGFGHREAADMFAADQLGEVFSFLLGIAPAADLVDAKVGMRAVGEADRGRRTTDFLDRDDMFEIAEPEPAEFFLDGDTMQPEFAHPRPEFVAREPVVRIGLGGERCDLFVGEAGGGVADHVGGFAEREIEIGGGAHGLPIDREGGTGRECASKLHHMEIETGRCLA